MKRSPVARISLGLVFVTCSILVTLDLVGLMPTNRSPEIELRARFCEQLAAQTAAAIDRDDLGPVRLALQVAVRRNDDVLSAALRSARGRVLVAAGDHALHWSRDPDRSRLDHVSVPIFRGGESWGALEVRFREVGTGTLAEQLWNRPLIRLVLAIAITCFVAFLFYLRRTLKHLDPSAVIPTRVQVALDVMQEGVLLLDPQERIVLANEAFSRWAGTPQARLLGTHASKLGWRVPESGDPATRFPWIQAIRESKPQTREPLLLSVPGGETRSLMINVAPVLDGWERAKGAICTFADVTELEERGARLEHAMKQLQESQEEIRMQNEELQVLVRRDPLTGVANRRAFLEGFEERFDVARREGQALACVMADIDHFKDVNDEHGHATGDAVIRSVAETLQTGVLSVEHVCRYGGEEFCVLLTDTDLDEARDFAESARRRIESPGFTRIPVTASFGVATIRAGARSPSELINQADEALYASKQGGRNRVTCWSPVLRDS